MLLKEQEAALLIANSSGRSGGGGCSGGRHVTTFAALSAAPNRPSRNKLRGRSPRPYRRSSRSRSMSRRWEAASAPAEIDRASHDPGSPPQEFSAAIRYHFQNQRLVSLSGAVKRAVIDAGGGRLIDNSARRRTFVSLVLMFPTGTLPSYAARILLQRNRTTGHINASIRCRVIVGDRVERFHVSLTRSRSGTGGAKTRSAHVSQRHVARASGRLQHRRRRRT